MRILLSFLLIAFLPSLAACKGEQTASSAPKTILNPTAVVRALGPQDEAPVQRLDERGEFKVLDKKSDGLSLVVYQGEETP
jgi:hypothetical protein